MNVAPRDLVLSFSEPVDPTLSTVSVSDRDGKRVGGRPVVSQDGHTISLPLGAIENGLYTVKWRVLSTLDGHTTSGVYAFAVGVALGSGAGAVVQKPPGSQVFIRWLELLAAMLLVGVVCFRALVLAKVSARLPAELRYSIHENVSPRLAALQRGAAIAVLVLAVLQFAFKASELLETSPLGVLTSGRLRALLLGTKFGLSALARIATALALAVPGSAIIGMAASLALLLAFSIASHAAARGVVPIIVDWLHLVAVSIWLGTLTGLMVAFRAAPRDQRLALTSAVVPRTSGLAAIGLGAVILTGVYSSWINMNSLRGFIETTYGQALAVKLALFLPLIALGALNRFVLRPRIEKAGSGVTVSSASQDVPAAAASRDLDATLSQTAHSPVRHFVRSVTGELTVAAAIMLVVAFLTIIPTARDTLPARRDPPVILHGQVEDVGVRLTVTQTQPGWHRIEALITDREGRPMTNPGRIILWLTKLDEKIDASTLPLAGQGEGKHAMEGGELGQPGLYALEVVVRRSGRTDAAVMFPYRVGAPGRRQTDPAAAAVLADARKTMSGLRAWREVEQISDGSGGGLLTIREIVTPNRFRLRTSTGEEIVVIGTTQFVRTGVASWSRGVLSRPPAGLGVLGYTDSAEGITYPRDARCDEEPCRIVLWDAPGGSASLAAWIGVDSRRIYRVMMIGPAHYMTLRSQDHNNAAIEIVEPQ
jgi:copper transport protein